MSGPGAWQARLRLDPTAFVAPGAVVVGSVTLGARSSVWFNTVVRGDIAAIEIGEDTNLQDNTTVHVDEGLPALVGARVTVGHRSIVHGCIVEDDCLIGMGSVLLSGSRIGRGSLVGAGALVRERQVIPPGSVALGAPARVVGQVTDAHREAIERGARHYVELSRSYLARGFSRPHPVPRSETGISAESRGPMSYHEWVQLLAVLAESPDWVADRLERHGDAQWRAAPGPGRWSAVEVLCHLRDADLEFYLQRLGRLLREEAPTFEDVDVSRWPSERDYHGQAPEAVLEAWGAARRELIGRLALLGPAEWRRAGFHTLWGPVTVASSVRHWVEHDLSHRRQIAEALGEFA